MSARLVTLTTDFGEEAGYVGAMRGAMLSIAPELRLVDISHAVAAHDVLAGAYTLASAAPWFPRGTVHLAVVDPGVGGPRRALVAQTARHLYVAPDNGLLDLALERDPAIALYELPLEARGGRAPHPTFHGRDLFGPAAARLAAGADPASLGPPLEGERERLVIEPPRFSGKSLVLRVLAVDRFGNVTTNLDLHRSERLFLGRPPLGLVLPGTSVPARRVRTYSEAEPDELVVLGGSSGYLEIALDRASAAERLGVKAGDALTLEVRAT